MITKKTLLAYIQQVEDAVLELDRRVRELEKKTTRPANAHPQKKKVGRPRKTKESK